MYLEHEIAYMRIILSLLLSLLTTTLFAQVEGKGIFCNLENSSGQIRSAIYDELNLRGVDIEIIRLAVLFKDGQSHIFLPFMANDVISFSVGTEVYEVTADHIVFSHGAALLDRKTLILEGEEMGSIQCEVTNSELEFDKEKERLRLLIQAGYNSQREDNRI